VRFLSIIVFCLAALLRLGAAEANVDCCTLTITVASMNSSKGVLGIVIFDKAKGWPEDVSSSFRHLSFPAHEGTQTVSISNLPPGKYAVALIHDVNENKKLDKNFFGKPKEQWGMSNNPAAKFIAPPIEKAFFTLQSNKELSIQLQ
jgi:uncharacterized protein (DUF2141 family)